MKASLECIPCFIRHALFCVKDRDYNVKERVVKDVMKYLIKIKYNRPPSEIANQVHSIIRKLSGEKDPYYRVKVESNMKAISLYPWLKKLLENCKDREERLYTALKLSIAGNIIDFGPANEFDIESTIKKVLQKEPFINDFSLLKERLLKSNKLLFFTDNAGEILFDRLLLKEMLAYRGQNFEEINIVVKGGPILNDAMLEDALMVGLDNLPNVKFSFLGNGEEGTGPTRDSEEIRNLINSYPFVIAKGQANFEGFSDLSNIFFLFIVKCDLVAKDLGASLGDIIIKYNP